VTTSTLLGLIEDIVISIVVFLVVSLRNTAGTVFQGANSVGRLKPTESSKIRSLEYEFAKIAHSYLDGELFVTDKFD
jgi:hypothetical protein